jgi:hypothetical protein
VPRHVHDPDAEQRVRHSQFKLRKTQLDRGAILGLVGAWFFSQVTGVERCQNLPWKVAIERSL